MSNRTTGQFAAMLTSRIVANALQALGIVVLARAVSPDIVGIVSAFIGVGMVLFTVTDLGASTSLMKAFAVGDLGTTRTGLRIVSWSTWGAGAIATALAAALTDAIGVPIVIALLMASVAIDRGVEFRLGVPIAAESMAVPAVSILLRRGVQLAAFLALWSCGLSPLTAYVVAQLIGSSAGYLHSVVFVHRYLPDGPRTGSPPATATVVRDSVPYLVNNVAVHIQLLDTFLVAWIAGSYRGGIYSTAMRVTSPLVLIPGTLASAVLPAAARSSVVAVRRASAQMIAATPVLIAVFAAGGLLLGEPVCALVFGDAYRTAGTPLIWLLAATPATILTAGLGAVLQAHGRADFVARIGVAGAAVFVAAVGAGAAIGGAPGAAVGVFVAAVVKTAPLAIAALLLRPAPVDPTATAPRPHEGVS